MELFVKLTRQLENKDVPQLAENPGDERLVDGAVKAWGEQEVGGEQTACGRSGLGWG